MLNVFGLIMIVAAFINALSQILLKKSADQTAEKNFFRKLLNWKVALAYLIFAFVFFVNLYAYRGVDFKYGGAIAAIGQVFVVVLAALLCNEKISKNMVVGNILIIIGVILCSLQ